jgi:flagellar biosynthesis protein FlhB
MPGGGGGGGDRTEKATPKRQDEARKKGQVAKSADLNGAVVVLAGLLALSAFGPMIFHQLRDSMHQTLALIATPRALEGPGLMRLFGAGMKTVAVAVAPIAAVCAVAGIGVNVAQVRLRFAGEALKPDPKRINPFQGAKNIFGPQAVFEGGKSIAKVAAVGGIAALAVFPKLQDLAALVGMPPTEFLPMLSKTVLAIAQRAAVAYLAIGLADYLWQRHRHQKQLKMTKQEVKDEFKQHGLPPEVRAALRRRQAQAARARRMAAVPGADVVVTNPTHVAVALLYDGSKPAPEVVAKGQDLIAMQIRRVAEENDVPVISDPPLARSINSTVEVGQQIPEDLFQGVAQLLAFVYRTAGRKVV